MTDQPQPPPLGALLEQGRKNQGLSKREAARRAVISEARWRQVVNGLQAISDPDTPSRPRANTIIAMARAVGVDPAEALEAAGRDPSLAEHHATPDIDEAGSVVRKILTTDLSIDEKEEIIQTVVREQRNAELRLRARVEELIAEARSRH